MPNSIQITLDLTSYEAHILAQMQVWEPTPTEWEFKSDMRARMIIQPQGEIVLQAFLSLQSKLTYAIAVATASQH